MGNAIIAPYVETTGSGGINPSFPLSKTAAKLSSKLFSSSNLRVATEIASMTINPIGGICLVPAITGYIQLTTANCYQSYSTAVYSLCKFSVSNNTSLYINVTVSTMTLSSSVTITANGAEKFNFSMNSGYCLAPAGYDKLSILISIASVSGNTSASGNIYVTSSDTFKYYQMSI